MLNADYGRKTAALARGRGPF